MLIIDLFTDKAAILNSIFQRAIMGYLGDKLPLVCIK